MAISYPPNFKKKLEEQPVPPPSIVPQPNPQPIKPKKTPFKDATEGNAFRAWMDDNYPDWRADDGEPLDREGKFDNKYIRQAYSKYGREYNQYKQSLVNASDAEKRKKDEEMMASQQKEKVAKTKEDYDNLVSYSKGSGFFDWNDLQALESRINKINDLVVNQSAKSDAFGYFYIALQKYAPLVYSRKKSDFETLLDKLNPTVKESRNPTSDEINNFLKKDLGDTGLWEKGKYFYYIPKSQYQKDLTKIEQEKSYDESDVDAIIQDLEKKFKMFGVGETSSTATLTKVQAAALMDVYAQNFENLIPKNLCNIKSEEMPLNKLNLTDEQWKKFKQLLADANARGYFKFGRSEFCRKGLDISTDVKIAPKVKLQKLFDFFSDISYTDAKIRTTARNWQEQYSTIKESDLIRTVRKNLITEKHKKLLSESVVIEDRLHYVVESVGLKNRKDVDKIVEGIFYEMLYLEYNNYNRKILTENIDSLLDALGSIFGGDKNAIIQTFKEKGVDFIMNKLGLDKNDYMGDFLSVTFANTDLKDIPRLFTDCEYLTNKIAESVPEAYLKHLQDEKNFNNVFMGYVRNALNDVINESDLVEKLKDRISTIVCPITEELKGKFEKKLTDMKQSLNKD